MSIGPKWLLNKIAGVLGYRIVRRSTLPDAFDVQQRLLGRRANPIIFDVGANDGMTISQYRTLFPSAEVHGFEPLPNLVPALRDRFAGDPRVVVVGKAIADRPQTVPFFVNASDVHSSMFELDEAGKRAYCSHQKRIDVEATTLDDYTREETIKSIDLLKMDIQGAELHALQGARSLLTEGRIGLIYLECWLVPHYKDAPLFFDIAGHLAPFSYQLYDLFHLTRDSSGKLVKVDALFIAPALQATLEADKPTWQSARRQPA